MELKFNGDGESYLFRRGIYALLAGSENESGIFARQ